jgi:hypothetical protein
MAKRLVRGQPTLSHPYDTNDYDDLPEGRRIDAEVTYKNRIDAVCMDTQHCTIANALHDTAATTGITELGRRGVSKSSVSMRLDPAVHPWADPDRWYRGQLTAKSASLVAELDSEAGTPTAQQQTKAALRRMCKTFPDGVRTVWTVITIVSPTRKKGWRAGADIRGHTGSGTKTRGSIKRRSWQPESKKLK